jgi:hypothetical protein
MKKTKYRNLHSLDDIHNARLQLKKKMRLTEKSISKKTDLGKLLLGAFEKTSGIPIDKDSSVELIGYLLPVGLKYVLKLLKKNTGSKKLRRLLIYSAIGGALAITFYQVLAKKQQGSEE